MRELRAGRKVHGRTSEWAVVKTLAAGSFGQVYEVRCLSGSLGPEEGCGGGRERSGVGSREGQRRSNTSSSDDSPGLAGGLAGAGGRRGSTGPPGLRSSSRSTSARSAGQRAALKVEPKSDEEALLPLEAKVARLFSAQLHAPRFLACGAEAEFCWMAQELLGPSLAALRKRLGLFSASTGLRLFGQGVEALREFHVATGFVHRDLKPGNLAMGLGRRARTLVLLDFGLSRRLLEADGRVRKARRSPVPFRGSLRYASARAHSGKELGRADDLWSLFYVFLDLMRPENLCWLGEQGLREVGRLKQNSSPSLLVRGLPGALGAVPRHLSKVSQAEAPDYGALSEAVRTSLSALDAGDDEPLDWEPRPGIVSNLRRSLTRSFSRSSHPSLH